MRAQHFERGYALALFAILQGASACTFTSQGTGTDGGTSEPDVFEPIDTGTSGPDDVGTIHLPPEEDAGDDAGVIILPRDATTVDQGAPDFDSGQFFPDVTVPDLDGGVDTGVPCDEETCSDGCCDQEGQCLSFENQNPNNCGNFGIACQACTNTDETCSGGVCGCPAGEVLCGSACVAAGGGGGGC